MSMHTPGPWTWQDGDDDMVNNMPVLMSPSGEVCNFGDSTRYYPTEGTPPKEDDKRLIAAAPELLGALQKIAALNGTEDNEWDGVERVMPEIAAVARAAIAKATGSAS